MPNTEHPLNHSPLGKSSQYPSHYTPDLLYPIERAINRRTLGIEGIPHYEGEDVWRAFEVSWLNQKGKPEIAVVTFTIPAHSSHIIESKSFKLYLTSFHQEKTSWQAMQSHLKEDISKAVGADVMIERENAHTITHTPTTPAFADPLLDAIYLDELEVVCSVYEPQPSLLRIDPSQHNKETLVSDLLKSNCPVTSQPDWGTIVIRYEGPAIDHASLLQYIVSYRQHNGFHEHCVEQIYTDIWTHCQPIHLDVCARYTRRGGLDINPRRYSQKAMMAFSPLPHLARTRTPRQ